MARKCPELPNLKKFYYELFFGTPCTIPHPSPLKRHIVDRNSWARPVARNAFLLNELNAIKEGRKQDVSRDVQVCMRDL